MTDKIEQCPDCHVRPEMSEHYYIGSTEKYSRIQCPKCGNFIIENTLAEAIEQWNKDAEFNPISPCPFCGHEAETRLINKNDPVNFPIYGVVCKYCGAEIIRGGSKTNAINAWNTRQNWTKELPSREQFVRFLKETRQMLWAMEYNADETKQLLDEALKAMGEKDET